jgi:radical SAM superfamily enzyme YgiQ (UPF0313 family)
MKKLLIVQPTTSYTVDKRCYSSNALSLYRQFLPESRLKKHLTGKKAMNIPPLSSMILASLTPDSFEITFVDEKVESLDNILTPDIVAISANTTMATRAYEISKQFREKGAKTVIGGMHASALPEEVMQHADSVVVGEAEYVWQELLNDFLSSGLKKRYQSSKLLNMGRDYVLPDHSILKQEYYLSPSIEITRGCPHSCSFCSAPLVFGKRYRRRALNEVIAQIEALDSDYVYFADDNIIGDVIYAKRLFNELKHLNKRWYGSASTILADDHELVDLMIESGCKFLVMGFESTSAHALDAVEKRHNNIERYGHLVRGLQDNGVLVAASFILGFDGDTIASINALQSYVEDQGFMFYVPGVLIPYPGTPLFDHYKQEGRLMHQDWHLYNVKGGVPVTLGPDLKPLQEDYLVSLKKAVKTNGISYLINHVPNDPKFLEKLCD